MYFCEKKLFFFQDQHFFSFFMNIWMHHQVWDHSTNWTFNPQPLSFYVFWQRLDLRYEHLTRWVYQIFCCISSMCKSFEQENIFWTVVMCAWVQDVDVMLQKKLYQSRSIIFQTYCSTWLEHICLATDSKAFKLNLLLFSPGYLMSQCVTRCAKVIFKTAKLEVIATFLE